MTMNYKPLRHLLVERDIKKTVFAEMVGISPPTLAKLMGDKPVELKIIDKICTAMDIPVEQVIRHEKEHA